MSTSLALDIIRSKLEQEQRRIGKGRSNAVTQVLNALIIEIAVQHANLATKEIRETEAEKIQPGLMETRLYHSE